MKRKAIPALTYARLIEATKGKCPLCGVELSVIASSGRTSLSNMEFPVVDHIVPLARGGTCEESNYRVICRSCNAKKGSR